MKLKSFVITLVAAQALSFAAWAHHSHGAYAMTDYTEMEGTVNRRLLDQSPCLGLSRCARRKRRNGKLGV